MNTRQKENKSVWKYKKEKVMKGLKDKGQIQAQKTRLKDQRTIG